MFATALAIASHSAAAQDAQDAPACDASPNQVRLQVRVSGLHSNHGNVTITLYPGDASRFLAKGAKLARLRVPAALPITEACSVVPAVGDYAISIYHDEDDNHKFNRNFFGLPAEGYGFSNNPKTLAGLPSYSDVHFSARLGDNPVPITVKY
ncbi:MAG: DUF2141 domain-containing protein [Nevskia sp.]|nr:DUF2141 domain-containing protein [Nevskia sp.]MCK9385157.1 DUF2141 domain-containing protein [Nevskia sp.]